ncbi:GTP:AMP phosphotransferase AK3, mitochondrial [Harmonia axyridis]|uniref:GTP:AMP phosphotransferase AK3, mitochondrial n=1 Tax=Harmonia axyridis TaxID=115357 RepID=UPI001E275267|nr:GTP:AMP phosphotransferase AK3, mitochondrial [Harmonia axyridis]
MAFRSVILGAPASGKGTISSRIVKAFGLEHIASGDRLRINIKENTPLGNTAKSYIEKGLLVPDDVMVNFISKELQQLKKNTWLLDGFPRTVSQAEALWSVQKLDVVLNLVVPFNIIVDRVKGRWVHLPSGRVYNTDFNAPKVPGKDDITGEDLIQRKDDNPEIVLKRLEQYENLTRPVINFYKNKGILKEFEGKSSDEIWPKVKSVLLNYLPEQKS